MSAASKAPEGFVAPPFIEDELRSGTPQRGAVLSGPCRIDTSERELEALYAATCETEDQLLTVQRVSEFMEAAITGGFADSNEAKNVFRLIALALDPTPSLAAEKATRAADDLRRRHRSKPEGKP